jgi:predicted tellurium resistance membrane protein TerC
MDEPYLAYQSTEVLDPAPVSSSGTKKESPNERRRFWLVVASLVLADFLVALDMVRTRSSLYKRASCC